MPFRFRLGKVLTVRQRRVDAAARELAEAGRRTASLREEILRLDERIEANRSLGETPETRFAVTDRHRLLEWLEHLATQRTALVERHAVARAEEQARREEMTAAWQDLDVLKRLEHRQKQQWLEAERKRESRELDEIGVQRADRARRAMLASERAHVSGRDPEA